MEVMVTTGAINRAKLQLNHHHQQTDQHPVFYRPDALPVTQPTMSKHWREKYHIPWTCVPQAHLGVFQLCLWPLYKKYKWVTGFALGLYIDMYLQGAPIKNNPLEKILYLWNCSIFFHQISAVYRGWIRPCIQQIAFKYLGLFQNYNYLKLTVHFSK